MNLNEFETFVAERRMSIVKREHVNGLKILFCEGRSFPDKDAPVMHWKMMYAIFEDETPYVAEFFTVPFSEGTTHDDRMAQARLRVSDTIRGHSRYGRH